MADHVGDRWVIRTNCECAELQADDASRDADAAGGRAAWRDLVPHSPNVFIEGFQPFDSFIAIEERSGGNKRLRLLANDGRSSVVAVRRAGLRDGARRQSRSRDDQAPLHLRLADHAADHLRGRRGDRRADRAQAHAVAELRSGAICHRAGVGDRRATGPRSRCRWSTARASSATAPRRCCNTPTAATARRKTRTGRRRSRACSTAAWSMRSRTSAAGRRWAAPGTTRASARTRMNSFTDFIDVTRYLVSPGLCGEGPGRGCRAGAPAGC